MFTLYFRLDYCSAFYYPLSTPESPELLGFIRVLGPQLAALFQSGKLKAAIFFLCLRGSWAQNQGELWDKKRNRTLCDKKKAQPEWRRSKNPYASGETVATEVLSRRKNKVLISGSTQNTQHLGDRKATYHWPALKEKSLSATSKRSLFTDGDSWATPHTLATDTT